MCAFLGPSLRPLDLEFMKHLSKVVNIVPVIAKADTMTLDEKSEFKQRVGLPFPSLSLLAPALCPSHLLTFVGPPLLPRPQAALPTSAPTQTHRLGPEVSAGPPEVMPQFWPPVLVLEAHWTQASL